MDQMVSPSTSMLSLCKLTGASIACGLTYRMLDSRPKTHPKPTTSSHDIGHLSGYEDIMELVNFIDPETLKAYDEITTAQRDMLHFKRVHLVGSLRAKSGPGFVNSGADKGLQRPQNDHLTETPQRGTAIPPDRATQYSSIGRPSLHIPPADQKPSRDGPVDESRSERKRKQVKLDLNDSEPDLLKPRRDTRENLVREHSKGRVKLANDLNPVREEVLPHKDVCIAVAQIMSPSSTDTLKATKEDIPPGARWTKIDRRLVNPGSLEEANEQFEERRDCVIVLRVLTKEEIQRYADRTNILRGKLWVTQRSAVCRCGR